MLFEEVVLGQQLSNEAILRQLDICVDQGASGQISQGLQDYADSNDRENYIKSELISAVHRFGRINDVHQFVFDVTANEHLAELCPDGVKGDLVLLEYCNMWFIEHRQYGEGSEHFGPFGDESTAQNAFKALIPFFE